MRIISGRFKAKKLQSPKTINTRPTLDRVKEALFSILGSMEDKKVLDLFSGTGNLALESISRGANFAWINDMENIAISTIIANVKLTNVAECVKITKKDYIKCLNQILNDDIFFDIIYLDPPYDSMYGIKSLEYISKLNNKILSKNGIIVYETDKAFLEKVNKKQNDVFNSFSNLECFDTRNYGNVILKFYKWR